MDWTTIVTLLARNSLTTLGGYLAANGFLPDGTTAESFVGAAMVLLGVAWSWWQKADHAAAIAALETSLGFWKAKAKGLPTPADNAAQQAVARAPLTGH
jgi:hypothetical protein